MFLLQENWPVAILKYVQSKDGFPKVTNNTETINYKVPNNQPITITYYNLS